MSITLTTTPLTTSSIQLDWSYSTFDEITEVEASTDGTTYAPVIGSPFAKGTNTAVATGLNDATKYYFRIKKQVWVCHSKAESAETLLDFRTALAFDGVDDWVGADLSTVPFSSFVSGSMQIKIKSPVLASNTYFILIGYLGGGNTNYFYISHNGQNVGGIRPCTMVIFDSSGNTFSAPFSIPFDQTNWHNLVWSIVPTGTLNEYNLNTSVDGGVTSTSTNIFAASLQPFFGTFEIGANGLGGGVRTDMEIDQFIVVQDVDMTLDANEIYNSGKGKDVYKMYTESDVVLCYEMNEGIAEADNQALPNTLTDRSPNGYDATMNNFAQIGTTSNWVDSINNP